MQLNLHLEKAVEKINSSNARRVCIQLPDGLKPKAKIIQERLEKDTEVKEIFFWFGSCYGGCDIPNIEKEGFDLLIAFGHSMFRASVKE